VEENAHSPSTFLNQSMFAAVPAGTQQVDATPSWRQVANTGTARWHDHRIHWMGQNRPPAVAADPSHRHQVGTWVVHVVANGQPSDIRGTVTWIGKTNGLLSFRQSLIVATVNLPLGIAALVWLLHSRRRSQRRIEAAAGDVGALHEAGYKTSPRSSGTP
jgi:hypothetical protein